METPTELLHAWTDGDKSALDRLLPLVYAEVHELARRNLFGERRDHTLQPTALVNETYLRLIGRDSVSLKDRNQFLILVAQTMRRILVDHARARNAAKRGNKLKTTLDTDIADVVRDRPTELIDLDDSLERLHSQDPRQSRVVELRYFGGYSNDETAAILGTSPATVKRDWTMARAWLYDQLAGSPP